MENNLLYHYTSLESLFAIIKEIDIDPNNDVPNNVFFKLRATHTAFLNDLTEGYILPQALKTIGISEDLLLIMQSTLGYPFIISLSELANDLNMWRCYANNGEGVSIGINKEELDFEVRNNNKCYLNKCIYVTTEELVELLIERGVDKMLGSKNIKPLFKLLSEMLIYKNKSFQSEEEWRIHDFNLETNYRIKENLIIPYREIKLPVTLIKTITFGPKCDFERNHFSIARMLKAKIGQLAMNEISFEKSKIPLI